MIEHTGIYSNPKTFEEAMINKIYIENRVNNS